MLDGAYRFSPRLVMSTDTALESFEATFQVRFRAELFNAVLHAVSKLSQRQSRPLSLRMQHAGNDYVAFTVSGHGPQAGARNYLIHMLDVHQGNAEVGRFDDRGLPVTMDPQDHAFVVICQEGLQATVGNLEAVPLMALPSDSVH